MDWRWSSGDAVVKRLTFHIGGCQWHWLGTQCSSLYLCHMNLHDSQSSHCYQGTSVFCLSLCNRPAVFSVCHRKTFTQSFILVSVTTEFPLCSVRLYLRRRGRVLWVVVIFVTSLFGQLFAHRAQDAWGNHRKWCRGFDAEDEDVLIRYNVEDNSGSLM